MTKKMMLMTNFLYHSLKDIKIIFQDSIKVSVFFFHHVPLLYYKCHKINPNRGRSYTHSTDWVNTKKPTINPINKKDNK